MRPKRNARKHDNSHIGGRSHFQRDRDRVLHSTALRRLAAVTQVVGPEEGHIYHNRLTHTLKVAQIARRLAETLLSRKRSRDICEALGGVDADVVETAALVHDLGHPPFGHVAESTLNKLAFNEGAIDGYEGNAQSFRIITKLCIRSANHPGLDLTAASLNASIKYPYFQDIKAIHPGPSTQLRRKWGAYESERDDYQFARQIQSQRLPRSPSIEAQIMDIADDIAYSIHDTDDFFRAGLIPLHLLANNGDFRNQTIDSIFRRWDEENIDQRFSREDLATTANNLLSGYPIYEPYNGGADHRGRLKEFSSFLINRFASSITVRPSPKDGEKHITLPDDHLRQIIMLKELTWFFVIKRSSLNSQQLGQKQIITTLFNCFLDASLSSDRSKNVLFPLRDKIKLDEIHKEYGEIPKNEAIRVVADTIASLNDREAIVLYHRLTGINPGSAFSGEIH